VKDAVKNYMKPDNRPFGFDIQQVRPMFYEIGGLAKCSCYMTIEKKPHGDCPYWVQLWPGMYHCKHGGGTMAGDCCVPYYRYLHRVGSFDENLKMIEARFCEKPEWHGCRLVTFNENGDRELI